MDSFGESQHQAAGSELVGCHVLLMASGASGEEKFKRILKGSGATITAVSTAREALDVIRSVIPDVVVSGPTVGMDEAVELAQQVRQLPADRGGAVPAVCLAEQAMRSETEQLLAAGYQACLAGPTRPESVVGVIHGLIEQMIKARALRADTAPGTGWESRLPVARERASRPGRERIQTARSEVSARRPRGATKAVDVAAPASGERSEIHSTNRLLAALGPELEACLGSELKMVVLRAGQVLYGPGDSVDRVYFPVGCVLSLSSTLIDGSSFDVAVVGHEGVVGAAMPSMRGRAIFRASVQIGGSAFVAPAKPFGDEMSAELSRILNRAMHCLFAQAAQNGACAGLHSIRERFCRWLLMLQDRSGDRTMLLTHEAIARALGVRRAGITCIVGELQSEGLLSAARGRITVEDRAGLERASCECYGMIRDEYERVLLPLGRPLWRVDRATSRRAC